MAVGTWNRAAVERIYGDHLNRDTAITAHLPRLKALAEDCGIAVEFGVKRGASSSALLLGAAHVISYDVKATPEAQQLAAVAGDHWDYRIEDSRTARIPICDLLFVDSLHTFAQCDTELRQHADLVQKKIVFHDVGTFGEVAANGETGEHLWQYTKGATVPKYAVGIRPAIDGLMIRDRSWVIAARYTDSHGLLVLERRRP